MANNNSNNNSSREDNPPGHTQQERLGGRDGGRGGGGGGGGGDAKRELHSLMIDCTAMRDEARALEVGSTIHNDNLVMALVPFLLALSAHEEHVAISRKSRMKNATEGRGF